MKKYQDKYRNDSARAEWWDYTQNGRYYVTICTENREHYFGKVSNDIMRLSHTGVIADIMWYEIKHHAKFVELDVYQVMPNHVHGILILNRPEIYLPGNDVPDGRLGTDPKDSRDDRSDNTQQDGRGQGSSIKDSKKQSSHRNRSRVDVGTLHATSLHPQPDTKPQAQTTAPDNTGPTKNKQMARISPKSGSLSTILRSYKSAVTRHAHRLGFEFGWQSRFHDHIIRDDEEYQRIVDYIINNPANWKDDEFY